MLDLRPDVETRIHGLDVLYISYDGLLEPLGASQIVPYLYALADRGTRLSVLSFERPRDFADQDRICALRSRLASKSIQWTPLRYHKRPRTLAKTIDLVLGIRIALKLARLERPAIVHARSYLSGLIAWAVKSVSGARFVFDMRGFWPEERVELGLFRPMGVLYRLSKLSEQFLLKRADHVVVLTESAKAILREREAEAHLAAQESRETHISVIPCCADLDRFRLTEPNRELQIASELEGRIVIGNIGAVNKRYMLPEMFRFFFHIKSHLPNARFVYLTQNDPSLVRPAARDAGLSQDDLLVTSVEPPDIPKWLSLFRLGVFFLKPSYAAKASSYTKLAEFLAAGVPVITNKGVGDVEKILGSNRCGVLVPGLTENDLAAAARQALSLIEGERVPEAVRESCRAIAEKHFALDDGVERYFSIYRSLASAELESEHPVAMELG